MNELAQEKRAARKASRFLKNELLRFYPAFADRKSVVKNHRSQKDFITSVGYRTKYGFLDRLVIKTTKYSFHANYGYDLLPYKKWQARRKYHPRIEKSPEQRDVPGTMHFQKVLNNSKALDQLATDLLQFRFIKIASFLTPNK